jgi:8-oxo-dGTP diphosphatase
MPRQIDVKTVENRIQVAAGILQDAAGRYLISDRQNASSMQDFWEFPGGKIMQGESSADALGRELNEELGIRITLFDSLCSLQHDYLHIQVDLEFFLVSEWRGQPSGVEGQELRWISIEELGESKLLPADMPLVEALRRRKKNL